MKTYYVYIMTNYRRTVLYIGFTSNLYSRVASHKNGDVSGFTKKYNCNRLVYFEETTDVHAALDREKELKGWKRFKKDDLIRQMNPGVNDLSLEWLR